jgi:hypothetical protein
MFEVKKEREHARTEKEEADVWKIKAGKITVLRFPSEDEVAGDYHDAGNESAEKKIDRNFPSPNLERRVNLWVGSGCC